MEVREGITRLGDYLFASNNKTKEVLIPSSVTAFGDYCFRSCEEIETFTIAPGSHLETVGVQAFYGNKKVSSIKLGEGVTSFGSQAFYGCISLLTFTVPASVETIAEECFYNCESMATITFAEGSNLTSIGAKAFYSCDKLTCIVIPEGVTTLGYEMFYGSSNLSYAIFPSTLTAVGERPFAYTGIKDIYCYADPEQLTWRGSFGCPNPRLHVLSRFRSQYQEKFSDSRINVRALQISSYIGDLDSFGDMTLAGYSLSYDGDIALKFYMDVADSIVTNSNTVMTITVGSDSKTLRMSDAEQVTRDGKTYYVFKVNILPTQMCTYITAQISCRNRVSPAYKYCVRDYVLYLLDHQDVEEYAEALPFAKAMVNYGAAAMSAINGSVAGFPNTVLSAEDRQLGEVRFRNPGYSCDLDDSVVFTGVTMTLGTENSMSLFFESEEELVIETGTVSVQVDADEPTYDEYYDEYYYEPVEKTYQVVRIRNIKADEVFNNSYTIEIEGHGSVTYSPARYCYNVLHSEPYSYYASRIDSMVNMVKALYFFAQAVNDYKN